jgi:hypothetical protein
MVVAFIPLVVLAAAPIPALEPRPERPVYSVGEQWVLKDGVYELTKIEKNLYVWASSPGRQIHLTKDLALVSVLKDRVWEWDVTPVPEISWPLEVGKWGLMHRATLRMRSQSSGIPVRLSWQVKACKRRPRRRGSSNSDRVCRDVDLAIRSGRGRCPARNRGRSRRESMPPSPTHRQDPVDVHRRAQRGVSLEHPRPPSPRPPAPGCGGSRDTAAGAVPAGPVRRPTASPPPPPPAVRQPLEVTLLAEGPAAREPAGLALAAVARGQGVTMVATLNGVVVAQLEGACAPAGDAHQRGAQAPGREQNVVIVTAIDADSIAAKDARGRLRQGCGALRPVRRPGRPAGGQASVAAYWRRRGGA